MNNKIYTISLSPTIDYILKMDNLVKGKTNRPYTKDLYAAGKGIHVSMMLNTLKISNQAIVFTAGDFEDFFYHSLSNEKVVYKKFNALADIRINLKLIDDDQTECSVTTADIAGEEIESLKLYLAAQLQPNDLIILSGTIPKNTNVDIYADLVALAHKKGCMSVVDSYGLPLKKAINQKPFLIKPNIDELAQTFKTTITSFAELKKIAQQIITSGVENVLVSQGMDGAVLFTKKEIYTATIPSTPFKLVNAAGAGDSMIGGFIHKYLQTKNPLAALKLAIIAGSATAFSPRIAKAEMIEEILKYENTIKITINDW